MIVVNPYGPFHLAPVIGTNNAYIPWMALSTSTINQPYTGATVLAGPFNPSVANYVNQYTDISNLSF